MNHKRVERIWRQEELKVPRRQTENGVGCGSTMARASGSGHCTKNHVWSYDFVSTRTHDGRALKLLTVLDEYRCLGQCVEDLSVQELVSQFAVEALVVAVLPRTARRDVEGLDPQPWPAISAPVSP